MRENIAQSLSMRRAWIEIQGKRVSILGDSVALHAESVDRNIYNIGYKELTGCRSPCGERG